MENKALDTLFVMKYWIGMAHSVISKVCHVCERQSFWSPKSFVSLSDMNDAFVVPQTRKCIESV